MVRLKHSLSIAGLVVLIAGFSRAVTAQPAVNHPTQWKASIERPTSGWDYDGKRILGHIGYDICLWDAESGKLLRRMKGHKERIVMAQFSPDGNHALSSSWMGPGPMAWYVSKDTSTRLWNLDTGRQRDILKGQVAGEFSPDGRQILTFTHRLEEVDTTPNAADENSGADRERALIRPRNYFDNAIVWETFTGRQLVTAKLDDDADPDDDDDALHFSPDGHKFVHLGDTKAVLYNSADGREIGRIAVNSTFRGRSACHFTSAGTLASVDREKFHVTDIESGRAVHSLPHGLKRADSFAWTHDASRVAVIGRDEAIPIWEIAAGKVVAEAPRGPYRYSTPIVSPDNRRLAILWSGSERDEHALGLYDMNTGKEIVQAKLPELAGMIGFSPDSKTLLTGGAEFVIFDAGSGEKIRTLKLLNDAEVDRWGT